MTKISTIKQTEEDPSTILENWPLEKKEEMMAVNMISGPDTDRHLQSLSPLITHRLLASLVKLSTSRPLTIPLSCPPQHCVLYLLLNMLLILHVCCRVQSTNRRDFDELSPPVWVVPVCWAWAAWPWVNIFSVNHYLYWKLFVKLWDLL